MFPRHVGCVCLSLLALVEKPPRLIFGSVPLCFQEEDLEFFSDAVFAGTVELLLRNVCKTFCGARFDFLESLRKLSGCVDATLLVVNFCEVERVFLPAVLNLYFLIIILCLANIISFLLLIIKNGR